MKKLVFMVCLASVVSCCATSDESSVKKALDDGNAFAVHASIFNKRLAVKEGKLSAKECIAYYENLLEHIEYLVKKYNKDGHAFDQNARAAGYVFGGFGVLALASTALTDDIAFRIPAAVVSAITMYAGLLCLAGGKSRVGEISSVAFLISMYELLEKNLKKVREIALEQDRCGETTP